MEKIDTGDRTNIWRNLIRTLKLIWKMNKVYIFVITISTIALGLFPVLSLLIMQNIINMIQVGKVEIG